MKQDLMNLGQFLRVLTMLYQFRLPSFGPVHHPAFQRAERFGNRIHFRSQVNGLEATTL